MRVASSLYKVDTCNVAVSVNLGVAAPLLGEMFLRPSVVTLTGIESIEDRLNDRDTFFPLRVVDGSPRTEVIGKSQVRYVTAVDEQARDEADKTAVDAVRFMISLELDTGEELAGLCHAVLPQGKRRPLDFINAPHAGVFVSLYEGPRVYVIHRGFIRRLREQAP